MSQLYTTILICKLVFEQNGRILSVIYFPGARKQTVKQEVFLFDIILIYEDKSVYSNSRM